jgi:hypothetical protein
MTRPATDHRLLFAGEVDRLYRRRRGATSADVAAGKLRAQRRGRYTLVSAKRAEELYGVAK